MPEPDSPAHASAADPAAALLEVARNTACTRESIEALEARLPDDLDVVRAAIALAVERFEGAAGALLLLAATSAHLPLESDDVWPLLPILPDIHWMPLLLGRASDILFSVELRAIESGRLTEEREALAILVAVKANPGVEPPPAILSRIRVLARRDLISTTAFAIGLVAEDLRDPVTRQACKRWAVWARLPGGPEMLGGVRSLFAGPIPEVLPTRHQGSRIGEAPVHRTGVRAGRNDPCPCAHGLGARPHLEYTRS